MEPETARILLSTMITAIPVVMTFFLIALFAFPRTKSGGIKNTKYYDLLLIIVIIIVIISSIVVFLDFYVLIQIDYAIGLDAPFSSLFGWCLVFSLILLITMPIFITIVLVIIRHVERK